MSDQFSDKYSASIEPDGAAKALRVDHLVMRRTRARSAIDWRQGGRSVRKWDSSVLAIALVSIGISLVASMALAAVGTTLTSALSSVVLWAGMAAAVVFAFLRGRPSGLLKFRPIDVFWGACFAVCLRICEGWLTGSDKTAFPSVVALDGKLPADWWLSTALPATLLGPVVEEAFFRCVILVCVYQMLRRSTGSVAAGATSTLVSAGGFVVLHSAFVPLSLPDAIQLFLLGATCSFLVLLTGRVWGALLVHSIYNATFVVLIVLGSVLA